MNVWHFNLKKNPMTETIPPFLILIKGHHSSERNAAAWLLTSVHDEQRIILHSRNSFHGSLKEMICWFSFPNRGVHAINGTGTKCWKNTSSVSVLMPMCHLLYPIRPSSSLHHWSTQCPSQRHTTVSLCESDILTVPFCVYFPFSFHKLPWVGAKTCHRSTWLQGLQSTFHVQLVHMSWHFSQCIQLNLLDTLGSPL